MGEFKIKVIISRAIIWLLKIFGELHTVFFQVVKDDFGQFLTKQNHPWSTTTTDSSNEHALNGTIEVDNLEGKFELTMNSRRRGNLRGIGA